GPLSRQHALSDSRHERRAHHWPRLLVWVLSDAQRPCCRFGGTCRHWHDGCRPQATSAKRCGIGLCASHNDAETEVSELRSTSMVHLSHLATKQKMAAEPESAFSILQWVIFVD